MKKRKGETGPLSQGVQAGGQALRTLHIHGVEVLREVRFPEPPEPLSLSPRCARQAPHAGGRKRRGDAPGARRLVCVGLMSGLAQGARRPDRTVGRARQQHAGERAARARVRLPTASVVVPVPIFACLRARRPIRGEAVAACGVPWSTRHHARAVCGLTVVAAVACRTAAAAATCRAGTCDRRGESAGRCSSRLRGIGAWGHVAGGCVGVERACSRPSGRDSARGSNGDIPHGCACGVATILTRLAI